MDFKTQTQCGYVVGVVHGKTPATLVQSGGFDPSVPGVETRTTGSLGPLP